jgi:hypothetical protein
MAICRWPAVGAVIAAVVLASGEAGAETRPLRVEYEAHEGCPVGDAFLDEVLARTSRARAAAPGEPALEVWVRIDRRDRRSTGRLVLWKSGSARAREVEDGDCRDVVSALALITALALDPNAGARPRSVPHAAPAPPPSGPQTPAPRPPPSAPPAPGLSTVPLVPIPTPWPRHRPVEPGPAPPPRRSWVVGAHVSAAFEVTPRPLLGGGLSAERIWGGTAGASARLSLELASTGSFDIGPGGVLFLRGVGRVEGCPFLRPTRWLAVTACLGAEVGFLRGEGLRRGTIATVEEATVPWAGLGLLPRVAADLGDRGVLGLEGGPTFPLVRRSFVFERPDFTIHDLPAVTWSARLGVGVRF